MKAVVVALILAACGKSAAPPAAPPPARHGGPARLEDGRFFAKSLGVEKGYVVWLPRDYDATDRRYPVIYMLHGLGGHEKNWSRQGKIDQAAEAMNLEAIIVMPDGDASFYANAATPADWDACQKSGNPFSFGREGPDTFCVKTANYEDYIVKDLVGHVDATYRTIPEGRARAIGGLSMGGFGALMLAMRNRDVFSSAASHSGVVSLLYKGPHPYEPGEVEVITDFAREKAPEDKVVGLIVRHMLSIFGNDIERWRAHDPAHLAETVGERRPPLRIYIDCGMEDLFKLQDQAQHLHEVLITNGVDHNFWLGPGDHDFDFWSRRIDDSLAFHAAHFARELGGAAPAAQNR